MAKEYSDEMSLTEAQAVMEKYLAKQTAAKQAEAEEYLKKNPAPKIDQDGLAITLAKVEQNQFGAKNLIIDGKNNNDPLTSHTGIQAGRKFANLGDEVLKGRDETKKE